MCDTMRIITPLNNYIIVRMTFVFDLLEGDIKVTVIKGLNWIPDASLRLALSI